MQQEFAVQRFFAVPLTETNGVFRIEGGGNGLSDEFVGGAETYDERYFDDDVLRGRLAETYAGFTLPAAPVVLDLGCGSGNSVIPTLDLLPQSRVVAADLSPQLLAILRRRLAKNGITARCRIVQADLSQAGLVCDHSFDLIVGNAILHHMLDAARLLREVCGWLRPGGTAVFFEPFASGQLCFAMLCERLAADRDRMGLPEEVASLLERVIHDIRVRLSRSVPYEHLEDKWLFTREYLQSAVAGVGEAIVTPLVTSTAPLEWEFRALLKHGLGIDDLPAPNVLWETLRLWDTAIVPLSQDLIFHGRIVVRPDSSRTRV
jgi:ubiquinone/menaquinone biosynthesis C-methylase UbiE